MTTGGPLPIATLGSLTVLVDLLLPPIRPSSQKTDRKPSMPRMARRSLSLRRRFFSAGGILKPLCCCRAAYGGGRDVFRGGIAKCIVCVVCLGEANCEEVIVRVDCETRDGSWGWDNCGSEARYRSIIRNDMRSQTSREGEGGGRFARRGSWGIGERKRDEITESTRD